MKHYEIGDFIKASNDYYGLIIDREFINQTAGSSGHYWYTIIRLCNMNGIPFYKSQRKTKCGLILGLNCDFRDIPNPKYPWWHYKKESKK